MKSLFLSLVLFGSISADDKSELILDIEKSLMASCFHGTVYEHGNKEMEEQIASFVDAGRSKDYIMNFFTNKYGERILAMPEAEGFNVFAWLAPIIIFVFGGIIMYRYLKGSDQTAIEQVTLNGESIKFSNEIESELKDLD